MPIHIDLLKYHLWIHSLNLNNIRNNTISSIGVENYFIAREDKFRSKLVEMAQIIAKPF